MTCQQGISNEIDAIGLCETWLNNNMSNSDLTIPAFSNIIRKDRSGDSFGGVALYLRQEIHFVRITDLESDALELLCPLYSTQRCKMTNSPNALCFNINSIMHGSDLLQGDDLEQFYSAFNSI